MDQYITIKDLAKKYSVSTTAIYKKIYSGEIKAEKVGDQYFILRKVAEALQFRRKKRAYKTKAIQKAVQEVVGEHLEAFKMLGED